MKDWFLSELRSVAAPSDAARFALDLSNQSVTLLERRLNGLRERGSVPYGAPEFSKRIEAMRRVAARGRSDVARVDIMLPRELVLHRVETFPAEAKDALRDEAWWRLDSLTPYRPETLCYDVALVGADVATGFLDVSIAVAPRDIVDEAIGYAKGWGFSPQRITTAPSEGFPNGPLLLQASNARLETLSLRRTAVWLSMAAALLIMVGFWRGVAARQTLAELLEAEQSQAEAEMAKLEIVKGDTLAFVENALAPQTRRTQEPLALQWLDAIAEALPPGSQAERVMMEDGLIRLEGVTDKPEGVLSALESAPEFVEVRYAAPLKPLAGGGERRHFVIEARLAGVKPGA